MQEDSVVNTQSVTRRRGLLASASEDDPMDTVTTDSIQQPHQEQQQQQQQQPQSHQPFLLLQLPKQHHCQCHQSIININSSPASNTIMQTQRNVSDSTIPRRKSISTHQQTSRNRSSAISAKSKTCYLSQYKGTKTAYFNSVLVTGRLPASAAAAVARKRLPATTATASCIGDA